MVTRDERRLQNIKQNKVAFLNFVPSKLSLKEGETVEAIVNGRLREYKKRKGLVYYKDYILDGNEKVERNLDVKNDLNISGKIGVNVTKPLSLLHLGTPTEDFEVVDGGSAGATEQDWVQVEIGGVVGYIRVFATK